MDSYNTLTPLQFFLKIFSLHNISYTKMGLVVDPWPYFRVTILLFVFAFMTSCNVFLHSTSRIMQSLSPSVVVLSAVSHFMFYFDYIVDLCFVYKYGSVMCTYYNNYDQMDAVFIMKYNKKIKLSVMTLLAIFLPSWLVASFGQFIVWSIVNGWLSPTTYSVSYFKFLIRALTTLDLISQTMHIRLRLKTITDYIEEFASFADDSANRIKTVKNKWGNKTGIQYTKVSPDVSKFRSEMAKTSSYYLLLIEQTKFLNRFFGVRTLMYCLYTFTEMITFVNFVAKVISGAMGGVITSYVLLGPNILRVINCIGILTSLVYYCEACSCECGNIVDAIDRLLVNKRINEEIQSSAKTLRKLVTSRTLKFTAAGFFSIESTLLLSLVSVVISYALVLVQSTQ